MDASNEPAITQQEIVLQKNNKVNEKHSLSDAPLGKLEFIIGAFGKSADDCSKHYELWDEVFQILSNALVDIRDKYNKSDKFIWIKTNRKTNK